MTTLKWKRDNDYPDEEIFRARKLSAVSGQYVISKNDGGQYVVWNRRRASNGAVTAHLLGTTNTFAEAMALAERILLT